LPENGVPRNTICFIKIVLIPNMFQDHQNHTPIAPYHIKHPYGPMAPSGEVEFHPLNESTMLCL
jgi:hypothetical protein